MIALSPIKDVHDLQNIIEDQRVDSAAARLFVPQGHLDSVITEDNIKNVVAGFTAFENEQEVINFITQRARKIFSILVLINHVNFIEHFIHADQLQCHNIDALLPMSNDSLQNILANERVAKRFYEKQWEFCAPMFDTRIMPRTLDHSTILPYLSDTYFTEGGFGSVNLVNIHVDHRPDGYKDTEQFVRKEIPLDSEIYENEVHVLSALKGLNHPNILKLIACYKLNEKHNIICPFYPEGSLRRFLERERCRDLTHAYMFRLLSGLASAIWALHELVVGDAQQSYKGLHQDLRPDNVLYDGSNLILADFGLSSIKSPNEASKTPFKHIPGYYRAPECINLRTGVVDRPTTRATDIFSLGCVIADMVVYLLRGPEGVKKFVLDREFEETPVTYSLFHRGDAPNPRVTEVLQEIANEDRSRSLQSTVDLVFQMLRIDPEQRPLAREVATTLYMITVEAYLEQFDKVFGSFKHSPDAIIESSRFESWTTALDEKYFKNAAGPTQTTKMFTDITEKLQHFGRALNDIDKDDPKLDHRAFIEVRQLNNELLNMLPGSRVYVAHSNLQPIVLHKIENNPQDQVYQTLKASFGEESRITQGVNTKHIVAQMNQVKPPTEMPPPPRNPISNLTRALSRIDRVGGYEIAKVKDVASQPAKYVLSESIRYQDKRRRAKLRPRIEALRKLLSCPKVREKLCVLPLYKLHDDSERYAFGILYNLSAAQGGDNIPPNPINLECLLKKDQPALETRFGLALKLAESLAAFHDVDWYHKDLTCFNILFLPNHEDECMWIDKPYLIGFQHSRQAADEWTDGPQQDKSHHRYHDPRYIPGKFRFTSNFQSYFDYYSLGIVLLEIGLWNTIGKEMEQHNGEDNATFSQILIRDKLPKLAQTMGSKYVHAVTQCLIGWNQGDLKLEAHGSSTIESKLLFRSRVVTPLQELCSVFNAPNSPPIVDVKRPRSNSMGFMLLDKRLRTN